MRFTLNGTSIAATITGAILLAGCQTTEPAAPPANAISGDEIKTALSDASMSAGENDYTHYFAADGSIRGTRPWKGDWATYGGAWTVEGNKLCEDYDGTEYDGCYFVVLTQDGNRIQFWGDDGMARDAALQPGNPKEL